MVKKEWIGEKEKTLVRKVFEPRYKRPLSDLEVIEIAHALTDRLEVIVKSKGKNARRVAVK